VARLKGSLRTTQPLFPDELIVLPRLLEGKGPNDFLFPGRKQGRPLSYWSFWNKFQQLCTELKFPAHLCHPHTLKHTAGMVVIKAGIEYARQYLGHRSIASTGAYLRVSDAEASRAAMAAFGD
jgi:integrase